MKIKKNIFLFLLFSVLLNSYPSTAQPSRNLTGGTDFVTINNTTVPTHDLYMVDSIDAGNQIKHAASFEIKVNSSENVKKILADFQSYMAKNQSFLLVFSKANLQFSVFEQRTYTAAKVKELTLSALSASAKEGVTITIKIQAEQVAIAYDKANKINSPISSKTGVVLASNYRFELNGQSMNRVIEISSLQIGNTTGETHRFSIEITGAEAQTWYDWFNNTKNEDKKKSVRITLLGPDQRTELFTVELTNAEVIYLSVQSNSSQETISRTKIGLRASAAVFK
ncbi:MAG: hypothetical protein SGI83_08075 [Bacteroidota bacterium]|nr:hypothetical protein [Bacteroidota bacterium]